jgi:hypothetical protein
MSNITECLEWDWLLIASENLAKKNSNKPISERDFRGIFGLDSLTVKFVYYIYLVDHPDLYVPRYLLWTLSFLKNYETEVNASLKFSPCNTTYFRNYVWAVIYFLAEEMDEVFYLYFFFFNY